MESWSYELHPILAAIRPAAARFREWAERSVGQPAAADCELALVEACNNLINHNKVLPGSISLRAEATPSDLTLIIRDGTDGFEWPAQPNLPEPDAENGRGIFLIHALMHAVEYRRGASGNELRMRRRL